jgi:hypothetical protein
MPDDELIEADLDEYLAIEVPVEHPDPEDPDHEVVLPAEDADMADRLLYKRRRLRAEAIKIMELATRRREDITRWERDRTGGIEREEERIGTSLEAFHRAWLRANPRTKTLKLPNGALALRKPGRGKILVTDEQAFIAWCKANGREDLLRYEPHIRKAELADEEKITRHEGVQVNDPERGGELVQTWRLMAKTAPRANLETGEFKAETVSVPGVVYAEPVQERFSITLTTEEDDQ